MPLTRGVLSSAQLLLRLPLCVFVLTFSLGCGGGPRVTFPEPRAPADDEEESATAKLASKPAPKPAATTAPPVAKTAQPQSKKESPPRTRATAIAIASDNAATAASRDESTERRPRTAPREDAEESAVVLPADLSAWTHDDFRTAKDNRDIRLVKAVALLGRAGSDAEANARLLVELLDEPTPPSSTQSAGQIGQPLRGLPQAIVVALAANPSEFARNTLKEILLGNRRTSLDDRTFTMAALAALVERGGAEAEALLYAVLTMPEAIRPPGRGEYTGDALQKDCLTLMRNSASPQLRLRLAQHLAHPSTPAAHRTLILPILLEPRAENIRAQTALAADDFDANQRSALARQLLTQARRSIDALMLAPDTAQSRADNHAAIRAVFTAIDPARMKDNCRSAEELWRREFVDRLAKRIDELGGPTEEPDLFALATSLPCDVLRAVVRKQLSDHWADGDALVRAAQFAPSAMRDPGMLLVLKSLPREDAQARPLPAGARGENPQLQRLAKERKAKQAWASAVQTMVATLMRRCEIAGQVTQIAAERAIQEQAGQPVESVEDLNRLLDSRKQSTGKTELDEDDSASGDDNQSALAAQLPLDLPTAAQIGAQYHLHWPEQLEGRVTVSTSPLSIHYARLGLHDQGQRAVAFFARQLPGAKEHKLENGRWLDIASRPTAGRLRSVDVMITRSKTSPESTLPRSRNATEDLSVEILWIEITDFMDKTDGSPK